MKKVYLLIIMLLIITGCSKPVNKQDNNIQPAPTNNANNQVDEGQIITDVFDYSAQLFDVTGGSAAGIAQADFVNEVYTLEAEFTNLPELPPDHFYEGWVVRKQPLDVISTGSAILTENGYENVYIVGQDLTDHDFYVLTLEPDDGNPAPADHILEGTLELVITN